MPPVKFSEKHKYYHVYVSYAMQHIDFSINVSYHVNMTFSYQTFVSGEGGDVVELHISKCVCAKKKINRYSKQCENLARP